MTHADRDQSEGRRQIARTRFGSWECPTCHARDAFVLDGDTAACDNCRRVADLPEPLDWVDKITRVGPHIDPDVSPEDDRAVDAISDEPECTCAVYVVDYSDPERYHTENLDREDNPACPIHGAAPDADRVHAYVEALGKSRANYLLSSLLTEPELRMAARAVIAIADREQATLLAKIAELTATLDEVDDAWREVKRALDAALAGHAEPEASETGGDA